MPKVRAHALTVSLDGFLAGANQSKEDPLGIGGMALHDWAWATQAMRRVHGMEGGEEGEDNVWASGNVAGIGASIMGRNMFGPVRGPWEDEDWTGWWGGNPPFHHPVFVLTHHARPSLEMEGGTSFHFITTGVEDALERARAAAGNQDVRISGGARTVQQYLDRRLLDEIHFAIAPIFLGDGARLFENVQALGDAYECVERVAGERALHVLLRRVGS